MRRAGGSCCDLVPHTLAAILRTAVPRATRGGGDGGGGDSGGPGGGRRCAASTLRRCAASARDGGGATGAEAAELLISSAAPTLAPTEPPEILSIGEREEGWLGSAAPMGVAGS